MAISVHNPPFLETAARVGRRPSRRSLIYFPSQGMEHVKDEQPDRQQHTDENHVQAEIPR